MAQPPGAHHRRDRSLVDLVLARGMRAADGDQRVMMRTYVFFLIGSIGFLVVGHLVLFRYALGSILTSSC